MPASKMGESHEPHNCTHHTYNARSGSWHLFLSRWTNDGENGTMGRREGQELWRRRTQGYTDGYFLRAAIVLVVSLQFFFACILGHCVCIQCFVQPDTLTRCTTCTRFNLKYYCFRIYIPSGCQKPLTYISLNILQFSYYDASELLKLFEFYSYFVTEVSCNNIY